MHSAYLVIARAPGATAGATVRTTFGLWVPAPGRRWTIVSGPGEKAGLKSGDVILEANGQKIERSAQLPGVIANIKPGSNADLLVWRDGKGQRVAVKVAELDEKQARTAQNPGGKGNAPDCSDGVVPYWSSHVTPVASEKIVPCNHSVPDNPEAAAELKRILKLHLGSSLKTEN